MSMVARERYEADRAEWEAGEKMADISNEIKISGKRYTVRKSGEHDLSGGKAE